MIALSGIYMPSCTDMDIEFLKNWIVHAESGLASLSVDDWNILLLILICSFSESNWQASLSIIIPYYLRGGVGV